MRRHVVTACLLMGLLLTGCECRKPTDGPIVREHTADDEYATIVIEAEDFAGELEHPMKLEDDPEASGGRCIHIEGGSGKPGDPHPVTGVKYPSRWGAAVYKFTVSAPGTYRIWGRRFWEDGCGNSFTFIVNGRQVVFGQEGTYDRWEWSLCTVPFELPAGENTLEVLNREDGVSLDKLILTTNPDFVPQGKE